jgi:hypothetical protein
MPSGGRLTQQAQHRGRRAYVCGTDGISITDGTMKGWVITVGGDILSKDAAARFRERKNLSGQIDVRRCQLLVDYAEGLFEGDHHTDFRRSGSVVSCPPSVACDQRSAAGRC